MQSIGLQDEYHNNEDLKLFIGMLDGLAFLPMNDVTAGIRLLRRLAPNVAGRLDHYYYFNYLQRVI